jgi:hypothetical protein
MTHSELLQKLTDRWADASLSASPGASDAELLIFEETFGLRLPLSFREYLRLANGLTNGGFGGDLVHFWSLDEIAQHLNEAASLRNYPFIPFADYSLNCWVWVLPVDQAGSVADAVCTYGPPLAPCAPTFLLFLEQYLGGDDVGPKELSRRANPHWKAKL